MEYNINIDKHNFLLVRDLSFKKQMQISVTPQTVLQFITTTLNLRPPEQLA